MACQCLRSCSFLTEVAQAVDAAPVEWCSDDSARADVGVSKILVVTVTTCHRREVRQHWIVLRLLLSALARERGDFVFELFLLQLGAG